MTMTNASALPHPSASSQQSPHEALLDLVLYPNPPLGRHGMAWVMGLSVTVLGGAGVGFLSVGAWPVTGFLGLDIVGLWLAFRVTVRRSRRKETIRLDGNALVVRRHGPAGDLIGETVLDPNWVQVLLDERRLHDPLLALRANGCLVPIGAFLAPAERRELALELRSALDRHRALPSH